MAGDHIEMDHELAEKPEVLQIHEATGDEIALVIGRLYMMWRLFDRQTINGRLPGAGPRSMSTLCGGTPDFWMAVAETGWVTFKENEAVLPNFRKRFRKSARKRMKDSIRKRKERDKKAAKARAAEAAASRGRHADVTRTGATMSRPCPDLSVSVSKSVSVSGKTDHLDLCLKEAQEKILSLALREFTGGDSPAFERGGLKEKQIRTLLKTAALLDAGRLSEDQVTSGLQSIKLHSLEPIRDRVAWFARVLGEETEGQFGKMLATVRLPKEMIQAWREA